MKTSSPSDKAFQSCLAFAVMFASLLLGQVSLGQAASVRSTPAESEPSLPPEYRLGPDDQIKVWAMGVEEIAKDPYRIDPTGFVDLPVVGRVAAGGATISELRAVLLKTLARTVRNPQVSVDVVEFGSQPVSVLGAVRNPGVLQLRGRKTLAEVLSMAGGLADNSGPYVKIARPNKANALPFPAAIVPAVTTDATSGYSVAEIRLKEFIDISAPATNILVQPYDLITVPKAQTIYVMGDVRKPGGFAMSDRLKISSLQALALAEGLEHDASPQNAKILRFSSAPGGPGGASRQEIPIDLKKVLQGKAEDIGLVPDDILWVPDAAAKRVAVRAIEAAVQTAIGVTIFRIP